MLSNDFYTVQTLLFFQPPYWKWLEKTASLLGCYSTNCQYLAEAMKVVDQTIILKRSHFWQGFQKKILVFVLSGLRSITLTSVVFFEIGFEIIN